jgi:thymidylate synthase
MKGIYLECSTISDAWFQLIYNIFNNSYRQDVQQGSFAEIDYRLQYPSTCVWIKHPDKDMIPYINPALNIPAPTTMEYVEDYFTNYLMTSDLSSNETYTYGSRINQAMPGGGTQLQRVIDLLKNTPFTNQAIIEIASPIDLDVCVSKDGSCDPACLRLIDFKVIPPNNLTVSVYFRSWDLWSAFCSNLGGIELLKQHVAIEVGLTNADMYAYSSGLHIYGHAESVAKLRVNH